MKRNFRPGRLAVVIAMFIGVLIIYCAVLYKMQIYDPGRARADSGVTSLVTTKYTEIIKAGRGEILDRNGEKLVSSRASYNVALSREALRNSGRPNEIIQEMLTQASNYDVEHIDTFPVTQGAPYEYIYDMSTQQRNRLDKYFQFHNIDPEISASDFIVWLKQLYGIPYTVGVAEARLIIGVRFELEIRVLVNMAPYVFAEDVPLDFVTTISSMSLPGVSVITSSVRTYHTHYAAHLLGHTGKMNDAETELYTQIGYPLDAIVGKSGVERAFEPYLHGVDGTRTVRTTEDGSIVSEEITEAVPGENVYLSIDIGLQEVAEKALADVIATINIEREVMEEQKATSGAVVVTEIATGQLLACASNPTFNIETMRENSEALNADTSAPLFNRATQGTYNPGSTFKPVTALAALRAGIITRWTTIYDQGIYTKYTSPQPRCWYYTMSLGAATHESLDLIGALAYSCNYYFYSIGDNTGPTRIAQAASDFGLGEKTGIEIYEEKGTLATVDSKKEITGENWYDADTLFVAIGQGINEFTPVQLANYAATIANGGTLYNLSLLHAIKTSDYTATIKQQTPSIRARISEPEFIMYLQDGMKAVASYGTASSKFAGYFPTVAAKTGTVQTGSDVNDGVFICYAPADNPQVAIAVVVEKGGSGAAIIDVARIVLDEYFRTRATENAVNEGVLIP